MNSIRPFTREELKGRVAKLALAMKQADVDAVLLTSYPGIYYYSGAPIHQFGRPAAMLVTADGNAFLTCNILEKVHVDRQSWVEGIHYYSDHNLDVSYENPCDPATSVARLVARKVEEWKLGSARVGFEDPYMSVKQMAGFKRALPSVRFVEMGAAIEEPRLALSPAELDLVRAADAACDAAQQCLIDNLRIGMPSAEITEMCRSAMLDYVLTNHPDKPFVLHNSSGIIDAARRAGSSEWCTWNRSLKAERGMILDSIFDCFMWGYYGNVERTISVGQPSAEVKRAFDIMIEANEACFEMIRPGVTMAQIDRMTKDILDRHGYDRSHFGTGLGRGIVSYEGHFRVLPLDVRLYNDLSLKPGMAFSIEPMLGIFGIGAFRHCNTVIVTETGCEVDSRVRRDMIVIDR